MSTLECRIIGSSGLAEFALTARQRKDLKVIVPDEFQTLQQRMFACDPRVTPHESLMTYKN